jgi:hypothetical protein
MCSRDPFMLWVGGANMSEDELASENAAGKAPPPATENSRRR